MMCKTDDDSTVKTKSPAVAYRQEKPTVPFIRSEFQSRGESDLSEVRQFHARYVNGIFGDVFLGHSVICILTITVTLYTVRIHFRYDVYYMLCLK